MRTHPKWPRRPMLPTANHSQQGARNLAVFASRRENQNGSSSFVRFQPFWTHPKWPRRMLTHPPHATGTACCVTHATRAQPRHSVGNLAAPGYSQGQPGKAHTHTGTRLSLPGATRSSRRQKNKKNGLRDGKQKQVGRRSFIRNGPTLWGQ